MNKLISILFISIVGISCKKEPVALVEGNWKISSEKLEYYNTSNKKVHDEMLEPSINQVLSFNGKQVAFIKGDGSVEMYDYEVSTKAGKKYLTIAYPSGPKEWEIKELTKKLMHWYRKEQGGQYGPSNSKVDVAYTEFNVQLVTNHIN